MKKMLRTLFLFILAGSVSIARDPRLQLDSLMNFYAEEFGFNGVVLVASKGEILLRKGYGFRDIQSRVRHDPGSIFQIASITKPFTSELILQLASRNKLHLDDKLTRYLHDFPNGDKITIHNLLTHTSGVADYTSVSDTFMVTTATRPMSRETLLAIFRDRPLEFEPGSKFSYSNSNYALLGIIIEKATGRDYFELMRENILEPCDMRHSGFDFRNLESEYKTVGYTSFHGGHPVAVNDSSVLFAGGGLYSSVDDMYKWHRALASHTLLSKEWQDKAYMPHMDNYGCGWFVNSEKKRVGHTGGIPGFCSYMTRSEENELFVILFQNSLSTGIDNNTVAAKILSCLNDSIFTMPVARPVAVISPAVFSEYEGRYSLPEQASVSFVRFFGEDGKFYLQFEGEQEWNIIPENDTFFHVYRKNVKLEFVRDEKGKVASVRFLYPGGISFSAAKD